MYPLFCAIYKIGYIDYLALPIDIYLNMFNCWQNSAGLSSGVEVFNHVCKAWSHTLYKPVERITPKSDGVDDEFMKALNQLKSERGTDKVGLLDIHKRIADNKGR